MVEYSFDEARKLLSKNLENAKSNFKRFVKTKIKYSPIFSYVDLIRTRSYNS